MNQNTQSTDTETSVKVLSPTSLEISNEDHTIMNPLRFLIDRRGEVELVGYSIPHPAEKKAILKIQNKPNRKLHIKEVTMKGLDDFEAISGRLLEAFEEALNTRYNTNI